MKNRLVIVLASLLIMTIFATACSSGTSSPTPITAPASTTTLDGATLVQQRCAVCHPLTFVEKSRHTAADWKLIVDAMISRGARLTTDEETIVVNYLSANYGQ